jgi:predicted permease
VEAPRAIAVIGAGLWEHRFAADPAIVGRSILLNNVPFTVIGVAAREFVGLEPAVEGVPGVYLPFSSMRLLNPALSSSAGFISGVVGRMAAGSNYAAVRAEADVLLHQFHDAERSQPRSVIVTSTAFLSHPGRTPILLLSGMISVALMLVWLLGCANVGNLQLARAAARAQEIGIRLSLGASRARIIRQLLTEGLVLALAAGALGVAIAYVLPAVMIRLVGSQGAIDALNVSLAPDGLVMIVAVVLAAASLVAFALAPALHVTRAAVANALGDRGGLPSSFTLRNMLLATQVAISVIVLVGAGLLVRRVQKQASFDPGIPLDDVSVVSFAAQGEPYDLVRTKGFLTALDAALAQRRPGTFGFTTNQPFSEGNPDTVRLTGESIDRARPAGIVDISPGYLSVLRVPFTAGRNFVDSDSSRAVALVNEAMVRRYWPDGAAIGKTLIIGPSETREIVGIVRNVTDGMSPPYPLVYRPLGSSEATGPARDVGAQGGRVRVVIGGGFATLVLRGRAGPLADEIAGIVNAVDSHVRVQTQPLAAAIEERRQAFRMGPMLASTLGIFALGLATAGMFGVFAYAVRQRTPEIGIRMALGARSRDVARLILAGHGRAVVIGLLIGLAGGVAAAQGLRGFLGDVSPFDPIAYLGVASMLTVAGLTASYAPVRRATRINPVDALRHQ